MVVMRIGTLAWDYELEQIPDTIEGSLEALQNMVGGWIETWAPPEVLEKGITFVVNEEGLIKQLELNANMFPHFIAGSAVAVGLGDEDFVSLTVDQLTFLDNWFKS